MRVTINAVFDEDETDTMSRVLAKLKDLHIDYTQEDHDGRRHLRVTGYLEGDGELSPLVAALQSSRP